jgi:hypothetical protein
MIVTSLAQLILGVKKAGWKPSSLEARFLSMTNQSHEMEEKT